jgi:hypothetical protein
VSKKRDLVATLLKATRQDVYNALDPTVMERWDR